MSLLFTPEDPCPHIRFNPPGDGLWMSFQVPRDFMGLDHGTQIGRQYEAQSQLHQCTDLCQNVSIPTIEDIYLERFMFYLLDLKDLHSTYEG